MSTNQDGYDEQQPCPACGEDIWVIATLDAGECPECGTDRDELFKIARAGDVEAGESAADVVEGGEADV